MLGISYMIIEFYQTNNMIEIYQYSAQRLKHFPAKSLDEIRKTVLYEKKQLG